VRARRDRHHVRAGLLRGADVVRRVTHVDRRALVAQRLALGIGVAPPEHRVDVEADMVEAAARVGVVLRGHHDAAATEGPHRGHRLERAGEQVGPGHAMDHVELAEAVGPGGREVGLEALAELEVEVASQQGVEHLVGGDRRAGLEFELCERGGDARSRVDERHVEVEPHHQSGHHWKLGV